MKPKRISRKEQIIIEARRLFAEKGYVDTSTKEIALNAEVSEALIFKHFVNKDALLSHIIKAGYRQVLNSQRGMMTYRDARSFLLKMIRLPHQLVNADPLFWKMQERLSHHPFSKQQHELFMKPVRQVLERAFEELGYENPSLEAELLLQVIDTLWKKEASGELPQAIEIAQLLHNKYKLIEGNNQQQYE